MWTLLSVASAARWAAGRVGSVTSLGTYMNGIQLVRSEEHTSELQSHVNLVCRLLLEKKKKKKGIGGGDASVTLMFQQWCLRGQTHNSTCLRPSTRPPLLMVYRRRCLVLYSTLLRASR